MTAFFNFNRNQSKTSKSYASPTIISNCISVARFKSSMTLNYNCIELGVQAYVTLYKRTYATMTTQNIGQIWRQTDSDIEEQFHSNKLWTSGHTYVRLRVIHIGVNKTWETENIWVWHDLQGKAFSIVWHQWNNCKLELFEVDAGERLVFIHKNWSVMPKHFWDTTGLPVTAFR